MALSVSLATCSTSCTGRALHSVAIVCKVHRSRLPSSPEIERLKPDLELRIIYLAEYITGSVTQESWLVVWQRLYSKVGKYAAG